MAVLIQDLLGDYHCQQLKQGLQVDAGYGHPELGADCVSFAAGLKGALRQDPDVILVGEMRDLETIETAILAAETGHLVMSTLHTLDAPETVTRVISAFPDHQRGQARLILASILKGCISQRLVPRADGHGMVPAVEVMVSTGLAH